MTGQTNPEFLQPQWFFPLFICMWLGITGLLSYVAGWASLASAFPNRETIVGERFGFRSGSMGRRFLPVSYGNCLFVVVCPEGFRLSILFLFRFLSPPFFVPWTEVASVEEKRLFFFSYYVVSIRNHWSRISIRGEPGRALKMQFDANCAGVRATQLNR